MMKQFEIKDERGAVLVFHKPRFGQDGYFESYRVRLINDVLEADIEVDGRRYLNMSTGEEEFFSDLAASWRGWSGQKVFESLEHDLQMIATADRTGHVDLLVKITKLWPETTASAHLALDASQSLDGIAREARKFFKQTAASSL